MKRKTLGKIRLRSGNVLTYQQREQGPVWLLNGRLLCGPRRFREELMDTWVALGRAPADFLTWLGIPDDGTCLFCASGRPRTLCPSCGIIARCESCALTHDNSPLCRLTLEYAQFRCAIRGGDTIDAEDCYHAIKSLANAYERLMVQ